MKDFIVDYREHSSTVMHDLIIGNKQKLAKSTEIGDFSLWSNKKELETVVTKECNI